jgi:hypothetical protein
LIYCINSIHIASAFFKSSGLEASNLSATHRHRILTGDSIHWKGTVVLDIFSKSDFLFEKYFCTMSASEKNPNLDPTKFLI